MKSKWVTFTDKSSGYCEGCDEDDVKRIAEHLTGKKVQKMQSIPYPAKPIIWQMDHPIYGKTPDFCFKPEECQGKTSCPRNRSCCD